MTSSDLTTVGTRNEAQADPQADDRDGDYLPPPPLVRGTIIGDRYQLVAPLGHGNMGDVFRILHRTLGKEFALKRISSAFGEGARAREMFEREAKLASSLAHPNIVSIVDYGEDLTHGAYMVMELVDGIRLVDRIGTRPLPVRLACELIGQIADALRYIHEHEIIHGDIKDANILLVAEPGAERRRTRAVLLDFGLARPRHQARTSSVIDGTPDYMAPERITGGNPSVATDIYSLGVLFYVMLTGAPPFAGTVDEVLFAHLGALPERPSVARGEALDERLEGLVLRALAKDPAERHPDAGRFLYELRTVMDMLGMGQRRRAAKLNVETAAPPPRAKAALVGFDVAPVPMAAVARDGTLVAANRAFTDLVTGDRGGPVEGASGWLSALVAAWPDVLGDLARTAKGREPMVRAIDLGPAGADPEAPPVVHLVPDPDGGWPVHLTIVGAR